MKTRSPTIFAALGFNPTGDFGPYTFYTAHDRRPVWYLKAPPTEPPSWKQRKKQGRFRLAAAAWRGLTPELRARWMLAAKRAHLRLHGFALFTYFQLTQNTAAIRTIERQSHVKLLPD